MDLGIPQVPPILLQTRGQKKKGTFPGPCIWGNIPGIDPAYYYIRPC